MNSNFKVGDLVEVDNRFFKPEYSGMGIYLGFSIFHVIFIIHSGVYNIMVRETEFTAL